MTRIIVAYTKVGRVIGRDGQLPWPKLPGDLKRFREMTMGRTVVMGRITYQSIRRPLPGRTNVVISKLEISMPGIVVSKTLSRPLGDIDIIGGESIYRQALEIGVDEVIATEVYQEYAGDRFFPELPGIWNRELLEACDRYDVVRYQNLGT